jgi:hypothetical protein
MSYKENYALIDWSKPIEIERKRVTEPARSDLPFPRIISDVMEPVQSQLDGKFYDSKSALRATYRANNCIEVGNDPQRFKRRERSKPDESKIKTTLEKAEARFNRGERVDRHKIAQA